LTLQSGTKIAHQSSWHFFIGKENAMQETMTVPLTRQGVRNLDAIKGPVLPVSGGPAPRAGAGRNVGSQERLLSAFGGGALALFGLSRGSLLGWGLALIGGSLLYRGLSGHCQLYDSLGVNRAPGGNVPSSAEIVYRPDGG
jgi:uncharacterized membrane protein